MLEVIAVVLQLTRVLELLLYCDGVALDPTYGLEGLNLDLVRAWILTRALSIKLTFDLSLRLRYIASDLALVVG